MTHQSGHVPGWRAVRAGDGADHRCGHPPIGTLLDACHQATYRGAVLWKAVLRSYAIISCEAGLTPRRPLSDPGLMSTAYPHAVRADGTYLAPLRVFVKSAYIADLG